MGKANQKIIVCSKCEKSIFICYERPPRFHTTDMYAYFCVNKDCKEYEKMHVLSKQEN